MNLRNHYQTPGNIPQTFNYLVNIQEIPSYGFFGVPEIWSRNLFGICLAPHPMAICPRRGQFMEFGDLSAFNKGHLEDRNALSCCHPWDEGHI